MARPRLKPLVEQVIVITGASSGIGLVTARRAAARGATLVLVARNRDALTSIANEINAAGGTAIVATADVGKLDEVQATAQAAIDAFGRIDSWINGAGVAIYGRLVDTPEDEHRGLFETNYFGVVHGCRAALPHLREGGVALITVGSIASDLPTPALGAYAASKHAIKAAQSATVITAPAPLPARHDRVRVFLGGSIDMGHAADWQQSVAAALGSEDVVILNPRRPDWNPAWKPEADDPHFREQVEWELAALDSADIIVLYLAPGSKSPVSLLELGLHARSGKLILLCPPGYWRKGNVDITAERYGIEQVTDFEGLVAAVKARIAALHRARG